MFNITLKRSVAALAVTAGLLATAGPASAILYNGHAGLGSSVYDHNQTDLEFAVAPQSAPAEASPARTGVVDGTSNTLQVGLAAKP
ncbi:MAG TPA: hypothetical protein VLK59_01275 [Solirubrobacteraceae bacterium]|nr:hypothetical protein [Solirubrobacteraceae bacterium]